MVEINFTDTASIVETNSSLTNVTAGWEEENSLTMTEIILISYACCATAVWAIVIILYKLGISDTLDDLWDNIRHRAYWKYINGFQMFLLIVCTVSGGWIPITIYQMPSIFRHLKAHPKKWLDLFLFILFNIMLNGSDVDLDILTAEDLGNLTPASYQGLTISVYQASLGSRCGRVSPSVGSSLPSSTASPPSS